MKADWLSDLWGETSRIFVFCCLGELGRLGLLVDDSRLLLLIGDLGWRLLTLTGVTVMCFGELRRWE